MAATGDLKQMWMAILGIFVAMASLLLIAGLFYKGWEKTQQSPRLRQIFFVSVAALYAVWMAIRIAEVIIGRESANALLGLPGGLLLIWFYMRAAGKFGRLPEKIGSKAEGADCFPDGTSRRP